jgi:O-antigen ligase
MKRSFSSVLSICVIFSVSLFAIDSVCAMAARQQANESVEGKSEGTYTYVSGITSARAKSLIGAVIGLSSVIIGWRLKARAKAKQNGSSVWPIAGLVLGFVAIILSIIHLTGTKGGFGTGGGKAGAIVAIVLGISGAVLSAIPLRSKEIHRS